MSIRHTHSMNGNFIQTADSISYRPRLQRQRQFRTSVELRAIQWYWTYAKCWLFACIYNFCYWFNFFGNSETHKSKIDFNCECWWRTLFIALQYTILFVRSCRAKCLQIHYKTGLINLTPSQWPKCTIHYLAHTWTQSLQKTKRHFCC